MIHHIPQIMYDRGPEPAVALPPIPPSCPDCGAAPLRSCTISSIFWREQNALMVQNIPALVCDACGADFLSDSTARLLDRIKAQLSDQPNGFSGTWVRIPLLDFAETVVQLRGMAKSVAM